MCRSQPASKDSEDADTVATADCSRWRPVSAPQPWWAMEPCESGRRSSTDGGHRVRARTAPRMNDDPQARASFRVAHQVAGRLPQSVLRLSR